MPKSTFFNLSKEKRARVIEAGLNEFASYPFASASVGRIIENAEIASGSFYQYFEDKLDLYKYILSLLQEKKMEYLAPLINTKNKYGFFKLFYLLYEKGIKFAKENPRFEAIGSHLMRDKELLAGRLKEVEPTAIDFYKTLLEKGISSGEIRSGIDRDMVAWFLFNIGNSLNEYIMEKGSFDQNDMSAVESMISFIKNGIGKK